MNTIACFLKTVWFTVTNPFIHDGKIVVTSGHNYVEEEVVKKATVQVLKCADCEHVTIGFTRE